VSLVPARRRASLIVPVLITLAGLVVLIGLGLWQLERKAWKEGVIAALTERLSQPARILPPREVWSRLTPESSEFRRVTFPAEFLHDQEALVYGAGSALRPDVSGPGYWVFTPARLTGGSVLVVNRGFIPEAQADPAGRQQGQIRGVVDITGFIRWPEQRGAFSAADDPTRNRWFVRDHMAIAQAKGWGAVAPFYIDQEAPLAPGGMPKAGSLRVALPNNHLQYALTWFGLAACLVGVFAFWLRGRLHET
jgi:surfeit locus 1 family protein